MKSFFTSVFFAGNRKRLREQTGEDKFIVVTGNGKMQRNGDFEYLFRQDSNFWYLTSINIPQALLIIDGQKEYLVLPNINPIDAVFGAPYDYAKLERASGISNFINEDDGWKLIEEKIKNKATLSTLFAAESYSEHSGIYTNPARESFIKRLQTIDAKVKLTDLRSVIMHQRMIKQLPEIKAIQAAIDITLNTLNEVESKLTEYKYEYEIEADLSQGFRKQGALGHSFHPVVAGGTNTCHLHYQDNNDALKNARYIYLDVGAEVENYAADITRTYFLKKPTKDEQAIYEAVESVQAFAKSQLKPGISIRENEKAVEAFMGEKLVEVGLIKENNRENVRKYYTHACSHYLGLDVHDVGDYDRPLEPGMVLTVEPGIYVNEKGFGVRIEDDVLITEKGCKVLSSKLK